MFRVSTQQIFRVVAGMLALAWAVPAAGYKVLWAGHYDLGAHHDPETGWHSYVWDFDKRRAFLTEGVVLWVGPNYRQEITSANFASFADLGESVWVLPDRLPSHLTWDEFLYLGLGTQRQAHGVFRGGAGNRGEKAMRLVSVEGSGMDRGGHFAMWYFEIGNQPEWIFTTRGGIGDEDRFEGLRAGFHGHYNTGFTQPGRYEVTVEFYGELRDAHGGGETTHRATWIFHVSDSDFDWSREFALDSGWKYAPDTGWMYPVRDDLYYRPHQGFWKFQSNKRDSAYVYDPRWRQWIYRAEEWYPWAYDKGVGWVHEIGAEWRRRLSEDGVWVPERAE